MKRKGYFIMVDGILGSGKSTILRAVQSWAEEKQHRVFRLHDWKEMEPPRFDQIADYDIYFTYEPTRTWVGRAIRYELSRDDLPYGSDSLAHAFALDREIMYRRFVIPALEAGKIIIQDRGVCSSLTCQPAMEQGVTREIVRDLPGNRLAIEHAPDALILTKLSAEEAHRRILARDDESKGVFGHLPFLKKLEQHLQDPWLRDLFESHGTTLYELDTSGTEEESTQRAQTLINEILITR